MYMKIVNNITFLFIIFLFNSIFLWFIYCYYYY